MFEFQLAKKKHENFFKKYFSCEWKTKIRKKGERGKKGKEGKEKEGAFIQPKKYF